MVVTNHKLTLIEYTHKRIQPEIWVHPREETKVTDGTKSAHEDKQAPITRPQCVHNISLHTLRYGCRIVRSGHSKTSLSIKWHMQAVVKSGRRLHPSFRLILIVSCAIVAQAPRDRRSRQKGLLQVRFCWARSNFRAGGSGGI